MQFLNVPFPLFAVIVAVVVFMFSAMAGEFVFPILKKHGVVDNAGPRSSHTGAVVRGMGLSIAVGFAAGWLIAFGSSPGVSVGVPLVVFMVSLVCVVIGMIEDLNGLSVLVRSVLLFSLALIAAGSMVASVGFKPIHLLFVLYASLFISGYINVSNFMDGLNGQSCFHGIVSGVGFAAVGWFTGLPWAVIGGLILAAAFAGFLPKNIRGKAFMGDSGSYLLGAAVSVMSIGLLIKGTPLLASIGPMVIYFGDVAVTMVSRLRRGEDVTAPHKEFTFHKIQERGYSHLQTSLIVAGASTLTMVLGVISMFFADIVSQIVFFLLGLGVLIAYLRLPRFLPDRASETGLQHSKSVSIDE